MIRLPAIFFLLLSSPLLFAQEQSPISIHGFVMDKTDQSPIPYVNIIWEGKGRGTVTNELGEFVLKVDSLPVQLGISHVGYDRVEMTVSEEGTPIKVALEPSTLQSVTITSKRASKNKNILEKVLARTKELSEKNHYGRAFYRQLSQNDTTYNELYEVFFDTRFNADGINDWAIEQGRYALLERTRGERFVFNKNFTLMNRIFPTMQPDMDKYIMPLRENAIFYFDVEMTSSYVQADGREVAVVAFTPKLQMTRKIPAMTGELYIDLKTYDVLKLTGRFESNDLDVIELQGDGKFDNYVLYYEAAFKPNEEGDLLIDYIKVRQTSDVLFENSPPRQLETNSLLTFYEYYVPEGKRHRLGGRLRFQQSDKDRINKVEYDPAFWRDNPIVKRTPVEEEVIVAFERDRQFGSIYLNNKNQVALLPELDEDPVIKELTEKLDKNIPVYEKVFLHTDKPYYARGETLWFKAYITDAVVHRPYNLSWAMYVELIAPNGKEVDSKKLEVLGSGFAAGDFTIQSGYVSGKYLLRAYTDQMRYYDKDYFFEKEIEIYTGLQQDALPAKDADIDLQLFPEGGNLVYGIPSQVAFKAIDENGKPKTVEGYITDGKGDTLTYFESKHDGMGSFVLNPEKGKSYFATANNGRISKKIAVSEPLEEGYTMSVNNRAGKNLSVRILCSPSLDDSKVYLIGQVRRHIYYKSKGTLKRQLLTFEIPRQVLPNGILQLTLMDSLHRPLCERLTFIDQEDHIEVEIDTNKKKYGKGSPVEIDFRLRDALGNPIVAEMSVAVTDGGQIRLPKYDSNIKNYLLLTSDLKGYINDPELYFDRSQPDTESFLDLVMLTNGWRRYTWQQVMRQSVSHKVPREGFDICGKLRPEDFEKYGRTVLSMIPMGGQPGIFTSSVDQRGGFCFYNVNFRDTCRIVVQAIDDDGKYNEVSVELERSNNIPNNFAAPPLDIPGELITNYLNFNETALQNQLYFDGQTISLNEVTVTGKKKEQTKGGRTFPGAADYVIKMDKNLSSYPDLLTALSGKVPGMTVRNNGFGPSIRFAGTLGDPLVLLDDTPLNNGSGQIPASNVPQQQNEASDTDSNNNTSSQLNFSASGGSWGGGAYDVLNGIPLSQVDRIEILKGASAAIYGVRGSNGVIAVYMKKDYDSGERIILQTYEGYYTAREFYVPKYESKDRQDLRSTLFWQPFFQTNKQGKATLSFPNSDIAKSFNVVVEGITADGQPVNRVLRYEWE